MGTWNIHTILRGIIQVLPYIIPWLKTSPTCSTDSLGMGRFGLTLCLNL